MASAAFPSSSSKWAFGIVSYHVPGMPLQEPNQRMVPPTNEHGWMGTVVTPIQAGYGAGPDGQQQAR